MARPRAAIQHPAPEAGVVLAITPSGLVTARSPSESFPTEGTELTALNGRFVGTVLRVFGPVARPYFALRPRHPLKAEQAVALLGAALRSGG